MNPLLMPARAREVTYVVWGKGAVPGWLRDYGAVPVAFIGKQLPHADLAGYSWIVTVTCYENDMNRYGDADQAVLGYTKVDDGTRTDRTDD